MDVDKIADSIFKNVQARIDQALAPLVARLEQVEAKEIPEASAIIKTILAGDELATLVNLEVTQAVEALPPAEPGKDAEPVDVSVVVAGLAANSEIRALCGTGAEAALAKHLAANPIKDGRDADPVSDERLKSEVAAYLTANPPHKGDPGKDGVGLAGALIDRDGNLVVTMTNGEAKSLGPVVGKDGEPGQNGLGFESLDVTFDGEAIVHEYKAGERVFTRRFPIPVMRHIGFWREGMQAKAGNTTTEAGSLWLCLKDTDERPNYNSSDWTLAARAGRNGQDKTEAKTEPVKLNGN